MDELIAFGQIGEICAGLNLVQRVFSFPMEVCGERERSTSLGYSSPFNVFALLLIDAFGATFRVRGK
jgi:hypothetical protein